MMRISLLLLLLLFALDVHAQGEFELGGIYYDLSDDFADTSGVYARGRLGPYGPNEWRAELVQLDRFDDDGIFAAVGNIHQFNEEWFSDIAIDSSHGRINSSSSRQYWRWLRQVERWVCAAS